ncbi:ABC transporter ATP-binding protein [Roseibium aggregatum]|uniref:ABC transporter ATP-binding protein n=1 Tax=Roseibium aggregatum TaxID=187304 RepID=A0A939J352_9HYPH|nr:ABC transporter ATP-binding protein [Roseibium aggregatum]MBN9672118.1 ABC transporter ATP-binding protein [Roseibium aggregatum]
MKGAHIKATGISHTYRRGATQALAGIDLEIQPGEAVALIGRSGCGKSTLLHILSGLSQPSQGKVYVDGALVDAPSPSRVMMFQTPSLYPWMSVEQNIAIGLKFNGRMREAKARIPELLALVELEAYAKRNVQDLSGGQQQRVALARSLALNPQVLLLDEPLSALDAFTRHALQRDIRRIAADRGITLVLVTHDINEAVMMADRAFVLKANPGRIHKELPIPIPGDRSPSTPAFAGIRNRLVAAYEEAAGLAMADADAFSSQNEPAAETDDIRIPADGTFN